METKEEDSPFMQDLYKNLYKSTWDTDVKNLCKLLGKRRSEQIKKWRVTDEITHSWRGVASLFVQKYSEESSKWNIIDGNQISGMMLCEAAMYCLNEKTEDGWN